MDVLDYQKTNALRGGPSFSIKNRLTRVLWQFTWLLLASWTPPLFHPWRRLLLRLFGAQLGEKSDVRGSARVWLPSNLVMGNYSIIAEYVKVYNQERIELGDNVIVSQSAHLCASGHDVDDNNFQLTGAPIHIGSSAWVATEAFLGPGCVVGNGAVIGARAVLVGHADEMMIYVGNPAKPLRKRKSDAAD